MDDEESVKTVKNDHDPSFERLLRETLRTQAAASRAEACLDADTLAAWVDDSLAARDRAVAEAHVADCARCQALLAAVTKTTPVPAAGRWWSLSFVRWLVPLTAVATAALLWVAVPSRSKLDTGRAPAPAVATVARAPEEATDKLRADRPAAPERQAQSRALPSSSSPPPAAPALERAARQEREAPAPKLQADRRDAAVAAPSTAVEALPAPTVALTAAAPPPAAAPSTAEQVTRQQPAVAARPAEGVAQLSALADATGKATAEAGAARPAAAPAAAPQSAVAPGAPPPVGAATLARAFRGAPDILIASPDTKSQWRIVSSAIVQRSTDGGSTWQAQQTGVQTALVAGAAPSPSVCWLVGRGGTVLLSIDGRSWRRIAFPEMTDLTSVRARDANTATVTTSDGRTFGTTDGGRTWAR